MINKNFSVGGGDLAGKGETFEGTVQEIKKSHTEDGDSYYKVKVGNSVEMMELTYFPLLHDEIKRISPGDRVTVDFCQKGTLHKVLVGIRKVVKRRGAGSGHLDRSRNYG